MRTFFIANVCKRIPRRWMFLISAGLSVYIISTYIATGNKHVVSLSKQGSNPSALDPFGRIHEKGGQTETNVENINNNPQGGKDNNVQDKSNEIVNVEPRDQNEAKLPVLQPNQVVLAPPPEVKIPHLYFNEEGIGQNGMSVSINRTTMNKHDQEVYDRGYERNAFNEYVSNFISVDRKIPETRDPLCENQVFPTDLPDTSVIICFLNEAWSVLVRSVHSVINTAPKHLLREIVLVDDHSDYEYLKAPLDVYMKKFPKVKIIRNSAREGLIRSRLNGAKIATGQVLTFLDSHIECATDWLQPLLARIKENSSHVVWPAIPAIDRDTFLFPIHRKADDLQMGIFNWQMDYVWEGARLEDRETVISPIKSPTMAGGLFSIDREYFYYIGSYDEEMRFWGAENLEISFRIWMCGGSIEIIPCSIIGHIFRPRNPNAQGNSNEIVKNTVRTAMVWMDQYKYIYAKCTNVKLENYGDISKRLKLREKLKCKSFDWYLTHVYPTVFRPENAQMSGLIHSVHDSSLCLRATDNRNELIKMNHCNTKDFRKQVFYKTEYEEIRLINNCLDAGGDHPMMFSCHRMKGNQHFLYRPDHTIFFVGSGKCLQWIEGAHTLGLSPCDGNPRQMWMWEKVPIDFFAESTDTIHQ